MPPTADAVTYAAAEHSPNAARTATLEPPSRSGCTCSSATGSCSSDLSFADLVLWVRGGLDGWRGGRPRAADHRPDGLLRRPRRQPSSRSRGRLLDEAVRLRRGSCQGRDHRSPRRHVRSARRPSRSSAAAAPSRCVTRHTNLAGGRTPSRLELTYRDCADDLARMVAAGDFPLAVAPTGHAPRRPAGGRRPHPARRRGPGHVRQPQRGLGRAPAGPRRRRRRRGRSPQVVTDLVCATARPVDESLPLVVTGRAPWRTRRRDRAARRSRCAPSR